MRRCAVITTGRLNTDHIAGLENLHSPVTIQRRCADLAELIAVARTGRADAALIIGATEQLTDSTIGQLQESLSTVVVVSDSPLERSRLAALGLSTFDDDAAADQIAHALDIPAGGGGPLTAEPRADAEQPSGPGQGTPPRSRSTTPEGDPAGFRSQLAGDRDAEAEFAALVEPFEETSELRQEPATAVRNSADITAVWGIPGAPGRTTVAVNLAAELALHGASALLIDADTYAASAAVHLGLLEESAGIAQAARAAEFGSLDTDVLLRAAAGVEIGPARLEVLTGLPRAERWPELRPRALERVLALTRSRYDHVVVDLAAEIAVDQDLGFDAPSVQRNSATRTVLSTADRVIAVGAPDPVGFARLVKAVQAYTELLPEAGAPQLVINKLRKQVVGRSPRRQLTETWRQLGHSAFSLDFLPWEPATCDAALRAGQVLAEAAPDSALRRQIAALAGAEGPRHRRGSRRRKNRSRFRSN
ncbi:AAA family ATPase [Nesterenkonia ebinurensis]|uniref:AAA family ATPase n=1 Tax=Nesterenkonia ebinurensis TaxID=2608252 RepID=UPI00123D3447|nr:chromosome partitioning protein [Nesterenkonia ebinurensis]